MLEKEQNKKIIWNAISAYLMIFISGMFLFNKINPYLNNDFVKKHTKSALLIHLGFLFTYLIFISNGLLSGITIAGFALNFIITTSLCIFLLGVLLFGIYRASKWKLFGIWEVIKISKTEKLAWIHWEEVAFDEREKLTILLAYIPFIWFYNYPKHKNNTFIEHATRLNLFITIILILLYNFGHTELSLLLILLYVIYVVFVSINLFTTEKIIEIRLHDVFAPEKKYYFTKAIFAYLWDYKSGNDLQKLSTYYETIWEQVKIEKEEDYQNMLSLPDLRFPKFLIYIPFINLIYSFAKINRYSSHIRNWFALTIIFILALVLLNIFSLSYGFLYLFLVMIFYWIGYIQTDPSYKMPYVYMWYTLMKKMFWKTKEVNALYNVEKNVVLKVEEK
jgi:hypothetical protein